MKRFFDSEKKLIIVYQVLPHCWSGHVLAVCLDAGYGVCSEVEAHWDVHLTADGSV